VSGSGITLATCKSAPRSRQIPMPTPHHSVFHRPDALRAAQPTASMHWMANSKSQNSITKHLRRDESLYYTFIIQYAGENFFKNRWTFGEDTSYQWAAAEFKRRVDVLPAVASASRMTDWLTVVKCTQIRSRPTDYETFRLPPESA